MENENSAQPLDALMTQLKLSNADLVNVSTEQLTFKMVNKGRSGRRISPNVQEKILNALLKAKPELKLRRRELFRYDLNEAATKLVQAALKKMNEKKIKYPQFIDFLVEAGINGYKTDVALNQVVFYGPGGEALTIKGVQISAAQPGRYDVTAVQSAIQDAQQEKIDHPTFLKRIYEAGISEYEVNTRHRRIAYKSLEGLSYKEEIPAFDPTAVVAVIEPPVVEKKAKAKAAPAKKVKKVKKKLKSKPKKHMTTKARMSLKKRRFSKKRHR